MAISTAFALHNAIQLGKKFIKSRALRNVGSAVLASKLQTQQNKKLAQYSFNKNVEMWNMQNAYNAPKQQMSRLQEAGLNPNLIYGKGTPGNAQTMPQYQALETTGQMFGQSVAGLQGLVDIENKKQELEQNKIRTLFEEVFKMPLGQMTLEQGYSQITHEQAKIANQNIINEIDRIKKGLWDKNINPNESIVVKELVMLIKGLIAENQAVASNFRQSLSDIMNLKLPTPIFENGFQGHLNDLKQGIKNAKEIYDAINEGRRITGSIIR